MTTITNGKQGKIFLQARAERKTPKLTINADGLFTVQTFNGFQKKFECVIIVAFSSTIWEIKIILFGIFTGM